MLLISRREKENEKRGRAQTQFQGCDDDAIRTGAARMLLRLLYYCNYPEILCGRKVWRGDVDDSGGGIRAFEKYDYSLSRKSRRATPPRRRCLQISPESHRSPRHATAVVAAFRDPYSLRFVLRMCTAYLSLSLSLFHSARVYIHLTTRGTKIEARPGVYIL